MGLTPRPGRDHALSAAGKPAAGIGVPNAVAKAARPVPCGFFLSGSQSSGGRAGGAERPAGHRSGTPTSVRSPTPLLGSAVLEPLEVGMSTEISASRHFQAFDDLVSVEAGFVTLADLMNPERDLHTVNRDALSIVLSDYSRRLSAALRALQESDR